ncbi:uncharacterized protein [Elaeis guineensis]|uniref:Uncharacterized protein LOC105047332 n=1 Tax=Elaeis guineensis var. tenera TaxID=51953 RepID=A0A6J0PL91_ELAGV|nr:uncharacterized protein LOC105047332 [Elaeis guineensis]XP_019706879.1 uncharacterized protein LOC105047332 [Elaeis guineensis]
MAAKPLTTEAIALTEKKMDMTLDDIIKMSKKNTSKGKRPPRQPIKSRGFQNGNASQGKTKAQRFMDSRSSIRQGVLAQRRSNFRGNEFPVTTEVARRAAAMPIRNRGVNWNRPRVAVASVQRRSAADSFGGKDKVVSKQRPQTLDALFANMKEQRMKATSQQTNNRNGRQTAPMFRAQWRGRGGAAPRGATRRFGNYVK